MATTELPEIDLASPDAFVDGAPHEALSVLRRFDPVYWQPMTDEPGFWAVLRHADVIHVARNPEIFSASLGGVVVEDVPRSMLAMVRQMLLGMDPPTHGLHRMPLSPHFRSQVIALLEERVRSICRAIMNQARVQVDVEFVHDVTSHLPTRVIGELFGLPPEDWDHIHQLAERNTSQQDPDYVGEGNAVVEMATYAIELAAQRRSARPMHDLTSVILEADFGGEPMSDLEFGSFFVQLVTAGNDTTKGMLASGLHVLLQHPDQLAELRSDRSLLAGALEEIIRYSNPLHYFRRTAVTDTEIAGIPIAAGDKVAMYYTSANRDEAVFNAPQAFDIHRQPNPHLSFGIASHRCLGIHLARLEGRIFFDELLSAFQTIELTGQPTRVRSNLNNTLKSLPIRLTA